MDDAMDDDMDDDMDEDGTDDSDTNNDGMDDDGMGMKIQMIVVQLMMARMERHILS